MSETEIVKWLEKDIKGLIDAIEREKQQISWFASRLAAQQYRLQQIKGRTE